MKKTFSSAFFVLLILNLAVAQSGGGTNFERKIDRLAIDLERFAQKVEAKAETKAEIWEARAERIAERFEDQWDNNWSVQLDGFGERIFVTACPEVAFLGIETHVISIEKAMKLGFENRYGSYVSKVMAKSSAETAGLQAFDYIYGVDEQRTSDNQSLSEILEDYEPGNEITLHFVRKGEKMSTKVKLAENYDYSLDESEDNMPFLGVSPADEENGEELDGVSVEIVEKSTAEEMGLKVGDVITSINGFPVLDWDDVTTAIQNTRPGDDIEVNFKRNEQTLSAKGTIKSYEDVYPEGDNGSWNLDVDWNEMGNVTIATGDDWEQAPEQDENRAFMGIYTEMISKEKAAKLGFDNPYGTYISGIMPNSPAEKAGLRAFDYIFGFDEYRAGENQSLATVLKKYKPGEKATVHYFRKGKKASASITFTKPFKADKKEMNSCEDSFFGIIPITTNQNDGVAISPVKSSTASEMGLKDGDLITHINGNQMVDWQDVTVAIGLIKPGETITVDYLRDGKAMKSSKPIKSYAETKNCPNCDCGESETVVIARSPGNNPWKTWDDDNIASAPTPRMGVDNAKVALGNLSSEDASLMRSKGVQLSDKNMLAVENLRLTPNTKNGMFTLDFNLPSSGNTVVKIYNVTGRVLYEYDLGSFSGNFNDNVDISQNGAGNYFLEITQSSKTFSKKITLSRS